MRLGQILLTYDNSLRNAGALTAMALVWLILSAFLKVAESGWTIVAPVAVLLAIGSGFGVRAWFLNRRVRTADCNAMSTDDIWPLMEAADRGGQVGRTAAEALAELVTVQTAGESSWASNRERRWMQARLRKSIQDAFPDIRLTRVLIEAQRLVGDGESVVVVRSLAHNAVHPDVRVIANSYLRAVIMCAERAREREQLVRAADAVGSDSDKLLQVPEGLPSRKDDLLLQPVDASDTRPH